MLKSRIITRGKVTILEHEPPKKSNKKSNKKSDKQSKEVSQPVLDQEQHKLVKDILNHEIYTKNLKGQERTDALLGELLELGVITEDQYNDNLGKNLKLDTVDDVEKLIASKESK